MTSATMSYSRMTPEELFELYRREPGETLKWEIVLRYSDMVKNIASRARGIYASFAELDDMVNEGLLVLADAVDRYDPARGSFGNYVSKRIRGMIVDLARSNNWGPRLTSQHKREIDEAEGELRMKLNRQPTDREVAEHLGISDDTYRRRVEQYAFQNVLSWEELYVDSVQQADGAGSYISPEQSVENLDLVNTLSSAITRLLKNQQVVLSLYYKEGLTMEEIASVMGITRSRVCQIHKSAITRLRTMIRQEDLA